MTMTENNDHISPKVKGAFDQVMAFVLPASSSKDVRQRIEADAQHEAASTQPVRIPDGMTPAMRSTCLDPVLDALADFDRRVHDFDIAAEQHRRDEVALEELDEEIARLEAEHARALELVEREFNQDNLYVRAKEDYKRTKEEYDKRRLQKGGVDAKHFPMYFYLPLLLMIGVVEWAINYMAILEKYEIPVLALGISAVLGAAVAYASHEHGTLLKQWNHFFGKAVSRADRRSQIARASLALLALVIALGFVGWSRYTWVLAEVARMSGSGLIIGGGPAAPSIDVGQEVAITMFANALVYLIGFAVAYWTHDKDPHYADLYKAKKKAQKVWDKWAKDVTDRRVQEEARLQQAIQDAKNRAEGLRARFAPLIAMRSQVSERLKQIETQAVSLANGLIREYRAALFDFAKVKNPEIKFLFDGNLVGADQYREMQVSINAKALRPAGAGTEPVPA